MPVCMSVCVSLQTISWSWQNIHRRFVPFSLLFLSVAIPGLWWLPHALLESKCSAVLYALYGTSGNFSDTAGPWTHSYLETSIVRLWAFPIKQAWLNFVSKMLLKNIKFLKYIVNTERVVHSLLIFFPSTITMTYISLFQVTYLMRLDLY